MEAASPRTVTAILLALVVFLYLIRDILLPFVVASVTAYAASPLIGRLRRASRFPRWICATLVYLLLVGAATGLGLLFVPPFVHEFAAVAGHFPDIVRTLAKDLLGDRSIEFFGRRIDAREVSQDLTSALQAALSKAQLAKLGLAAVTSFFGVILIGVLLLYFLLTGPQIEAGLFALVPPKQRALMRLIWSDLNPVLRRYFVGVGVVVAYAATAAYIGLGLILHLKHAAVLAVLTGFLEMIPVLGPGISAVAAGFVAVRMATSVWSIVAYAIYATALRLSIDQVLGPIVLGRAARVHPALIILGFLSGGVLFGVTGMILAVPVIIAIKVILRTLYRDPAEYQS